MKHYIFAVSLILLLKPVLLLAADVVPNEIKMPGTQPREVSSPVPQPGDFNSLDPAGQCHFCHGGYNSAVEPSHNWQGSMMSHAGRDPLFWATLAVAEQDIDGSGDLCIRCHSPSGWLAGRSVPTDGSALTNRDHDGIECDACHRFTNPDQSEHLGVQNPPFIANDEGSPALGYYGAAQYVLWDDVDKLGPYSDAVARHPTLDSNYHRSVDFCGTCHDVSNPAVGDLAHNNGAQVPLEPGSYSGVPGSSLETKAAFNNFPHQYGIVERTFSEYKAGLLSQTLVSDYKKLPEDLQAGVIKDVYEKALLAGKDGNYEDGTKRYFSCQTCHLPPVVGEAASRIHNQPKLRKDLPQHDLTGGNYWTPVAIQYLDAQGKLRLGGGLSADQIAAMADGIERAKANLKQAVTIKVNDGTLKVTNLTGHKLISGYPEGRRMWLNMKWYDAEGILLREDGAYGPLTVDINGTSTEVRTILDLHDPKTRIYEAHGAMTQEWAKQLLGLGVSKDLPLSFDRVSGEVSMTLEQLAKHEPGSYHETFHFVLNNYLAKDNRIPPYGMSYDEARRRNALPVPADQFGNPGAGGTYDYWDRVPLYPPAGAVTATIDLLYQPTSWEYIQFLYRANTRSNDFLADEGMNLLDAWLNTGMAEPYVMASTAWTAPGYKGGGK